MRQSVPRQVTTMRGVAGLAIFLSSLLAGSWFIPNTQAETPSASCSAKSADTFSQTVRPFLSRYCQDCHSTKAHKGNLDLERFSSVEHVRRDTKPWQNTIEMLQTGEMPPKDKLQPTAEERQQIIEWIRSLLSAEALARAGDPGRVPVRRLSNTEYDNAIRDLTGVNLKPAKEFPADGAAGEGFTNAAEALTDLSPTLLAKYLAAAKEVAAHAVLLPDGFRFSQSKMRRDWTDEGTAALRKFYAECAPGDGKLDVQPYIAATLAHRDAIRSGKADIASVAASRKLTPRYLQSLWSMLNAQTTTQPLATIRSRWQQASVTDAAGIAKDISAWQSSLWRTVKVGNYVQADWHSKPGTAFVESLTRQVPVEPTFRDSETFRLPPQPQLGGGDVTVYLSPSHLSTSTGPVLWSKPRFEAPGKPTLQLCDYKTYGANFEADLTTGFRDTARYLQAVLDQTDQTLEAPQLAKERSLNPALLARWIDLLALKPAAASKHAMSPVPALTSLTEKTPRNEKFPTVSGWRKNNAELPIVVANNSDQVLNIPGRIGLKKVAVHPMPKEFVAITWRAPEASEIGAAAKITHAHPACGNGVVWRLEHRRGDNGVALQNGVSPLGQSSSVQVASVKVDAGDLIVLIVDAGAGSHICDLTEVDFTISQTARDGRRWDLSTDLATSIQAANPHDDSYGNRAVWGFASGLSTGSIGKATTPWVAGSVLDRWRQAARSKDRPANIGELAQAVQLALTGPKPAKDPDRALYDQLVSTDGPILRGVDLKSVLTPRASNAPALGLPADRFGRQGDALADAESLVAAGDETITIRLPAGLLKQYAFVVDGSLVGNTADRVVQFQLSLGPPTSSFSWDGKSPLVGKADSQAAKGVAAGFNAFRELFPLYTCFPAVVPTDEVVTLKLFHREDEPLKRLFLSEEESRQLDKLWADHRFISRQPVAEFDQLPQFMGYTTQDTPKPFQQFFINRKPRFQADAQAFLAEESEASPRQIDELLAFASRAWRRPLGDTERANLRALHKQLIDRGRPHDEAFRAILVRIFVSPTFLLRMEQPPAGERPAPVTDWELAFRLSGFLWSSIPDQALRDSAAAGKLRDPMVLTAHVRRMLNDERARSLATEFGTQWIHVRGFDSLAEKNERLFPMFDEALRAAMYEESIQVFLDLFRENRSVLSLLDSNATFLNEPLAKHYGVPGVSGNQWRRVDGLQKFDRGGLLGLGSVHARQAGASRTSPVLRGNWVVETLLGEKLPRPPANVPPIADTGDATELTVRQQVERHVSDAACAVCHQRIDPFGFTFEHFDAIGRYRDTEPNGKPIDASAKLKDGTHLQGIVGLRNYLLTHKRETFVRVFCRRLLGYALCRGVVLSDEPLIDRMSKRLLEPDARVGDAVHLIVTSQQFQMIRGADVADEP